MKILGKKQKLINFKIDFRHKHVTFFMTDSNMKQVVRDDKLNRKQPYNETYFKQKFVQREIINILEFLLPKMKNMNELIQQAEFFDLKIIPKEKHVLFEFNGIKLSEQELGKMNGTICVWINSDRSVLTACYKIWNYPVM